MNTPPCSTALESHGLDREGVTASPASSVVGVDLGACLRESVCLVEDRKERSGSRLVAEVLTSQCHNPPSWEQVNRLLGWDRSNFTSQTARGVVRSWQENLSLCWSFHLCRVKFNLDPYKLPDID